MTDQSASLTWDVFVAPSELLSGGDGAPGEKQAFWSPVSATLISGERDAVLVDALLTVSQANDLAEWIAATGKNLTAVYITHGHGDHWFGLGAVLDRFLALGRLRSPRSSRCIATAPTLTRSGSRRKP